MSNQYTTIGKLANKKITDSEIIREVLFDYNDGNFRGMIALIEEYGPHEFFQDLYEVIENQTWRSQTNKFLNFVGVTIEYLKFRPGDPEENETSKGSNFTESAFFQ
jgi:hypothetical protein